MTRRDRHDGDRRDQDRREGPADEEQQRRPGDVDLQEGDSLTALKGILSKVASLLRPLQLTPEESIRLVEQLYGSVLDMDLKLAGESDDTRKSSVLGHIQNTVIRRDGDKLVVEYPVERESRPASVAPSAGERPSEPKLPGKSTEPGLPGTSTEPTLPGAD